jgi:hypothetical protein
MCVKFGKSLFEEHPDMPNHGHREDVLSHELEFLSLP